MKKIEVKDFSLERTIENGQFFLYEKVESFYYFILNGKFIKIKQENNTLFYDGIEEKEISHFLTLDLNYKELTKDFNEDIHLNEALKKYYGMRLLRQPLWETIIGFVCSSAANIPKIRMNLMLISEFFGEKREGLGRTYFTFPKPGKINNLDMLIKAKLGYRAKFVFAINEIVKNNPKILNQIKKANYEDSKNMLMEFPGIGEKVADCICLFALEHSEACPVDTWVRQATEKLYLKRKSKNNKEVYSILQKKLKKNLGIKQQYLFEYIRKS